MTIIKFVGAALCAVLLSSCMLFGVDEQKEKLDAYCRFEGSTSTAQTKPQPIVALLLQRAEGNSSGNPWRLADHFVMAQPGPWLFVANEGQYRLAAFVDANADLVYQPGEAYVATPKEEPLSCTPGARFNDIKLAIPATSPPLDREIDVAALQARSVEAQTSKTLGQLTVVGEIVSLSDQRFNAENAANGLWKPYDTMFAMPPGVYFLEAYDPQKIPVLFVHGISDTPARFSYLTERLDRKRFQPWVYTYPTGVHLNAAADHLNQTMAKLRARHHFERLAVVSHSMGGLVSRGYLLRNAADKNAGTTPLFVSISTPWGGHKAAQSGVEHAPEVVRVWYDMAPDSEYLRSLFATSLPPETQYHLLFTFRRDSSSFGESGDQSVTVASQLSAQAQHDAVRLYGFDDSHTGVLSNADTSTLLNELLAKSFP